MDLNSIKSNRCAIPEIKTLQVVLKVAERCNINCTYCYYFNMGDTSALDRPALINLKTCRSVAEWIRDGCKELGIGRVAISFHGGEPFLLKPRVFDEACEILRTTIGEIASVDFSVQTNGTILFDQWLDVLRRHRIHVGVSIDGTRKANDRFRLTKDGRSTFDVLETNIKRLVDWSDGDQGLGPSTISVMHHDNDYAEIYTYLRSLGIMNMSFLLPDMSYDDASDERNEKSYGKCLSDLFYAWLVEDNADVNVRQVKDVMRHFQNRPVPPPNTVASSLAGKETVNYQILVAHSDGTISVNDSLTPALEWFNATPRIDVRCITMREFLAHEVFGYIRKAEAKLPVKCMDCTWRGICRAGDLENRFDSKNGFDNPSVFCADYQTYYEDVCHHLLANNYPPDLMVERIENTLQVT